MTGLDPFKDHIIEICCLISDGQLNIADPNGFEAVIHFPKDVMDNMNEWCIDHHGTSGLTEQVIASTNTTEQIEQQLLEYLQTHIKEPKTGVLCGNSIQHDRMFLTREFPKVIDFLHYRQIDVSTIKEIGYRHNPSLMQKVPKKLGLHTARADITESIAELKWYYDNYLQKE
jgi:oligoribonuclease